MLSGVAFSNSSMTSFSPVHSNFRQPPLFLGGKFLFKLTRTLTIFGDYGILAHIP